METKMKERLCCMCGKDQSQEISMVVSKATDATLCEECCENAFRYFTILNENIGKALAESVMTDSNRDADGNCTCPKCILNRLMNASLSSASETTPNAPSTKTRQ